MLGRRSRTRWALACAALLSCFSALAACSLAVNFDGLIGAPLDASVDASVDTTSSDALGVSSDSQDDDASAGPQVTRMTLTDCSTGADVRTLQDGDTISRATAPAQFSLRAYTNPTVVGSVEFQVDGTPVRVEDTPTYDIAGGSTTIPNPWTIADGSYTIAAQAFVGGDASGVDGAPFVIHLTITE